MALIDLILQHPDIAKLPGHSGEATAWCPWHDDRAGRNPSLGINTNKKKVKCWSCGKGGLNKLAKAWGIEDPDRDGRKRQAPDPFLSAPAAMQRLTEIYQLRQETIDHFHIEPKPDTPSANRKSRGAWTYPTPAGTRFKAFDRSSKPKYWWSRGTKQEARLIALYGLGEVVPGAERVYLVNGEPSVWVCWQAGIPAVCAFGEGNLHPDAVKRLADLGVGEVRILLDLDQAGEKSTLRDVEIIRDSELNVSAGQLPDYLGEKGDVADLYLWLKGDDAAFRKELEELPDKDLPGPDPLKWTRYFERDGRYYMKQETRDGPIDIPLTNFVAWLDQEIQYDDGRDRKLEFLVGGRRDDGHPFQQIQITAAKFHTLEWLHDPWGAYAVIRAGAGYKDNVREIIQLISIARGLKRKTIYTHTGWEDIAADNLFLMPGGAIGMEEIEVKLEEPSYQHYALPNTPENVKEAVAASLRFLDVADRKITIPMFAFTYLAPLQSILMPAFTLWLRANSGAFKSTLTALAMCHFGDFQYNTPPATWEASARGIERLLYDLKDCMAWIDDFNPLSSERLMQQQYAKADGVLRALGNLQGRVRMRADLTMQKTYPPRAALITTGEIYPTGLSVLARMLAVDYTRSQVDKRVLTEVQALAHHFPHGMSAYVQWMAPQYEELKKALPEQYRMLRTLASSNEDQEHARTPGSLAALQVAMDNFAEFAISVGGQSRAAMQELSDETWLVFQNIGRNQEAMLRDESPLDRYLQTIDTLLAQKKVVLHLRGSEIDPPFGQDLIGWYDTEFVYLDPVATYNRVAKWYRDEGRTLGITEGVLRKSLLEEGILVRPSDSDSHLTSRLSVNGRRHNVMTLHIEKLPFGDLFNLFKGRMPI